MRYISTTKMESFLTKQQIDNINDVLMRAMQAYTGRNPNVSAERYNRHFNQIYRGLVREAYELYHTADQGKPTELQDESK